jgi:predicted Zn-dependent protease
VGAALLALSLPAWAKPDLDEVLGAEAPAPAREAVVWVGPEVAAPTAEQLADPGYFSAHPKALVAYVKQHPERLDVEKMTPPLVQTLAQLLLAAEDVFRAETLLSQATAKWPEEGAIRRDWARVLIRLGRPEGALREIERALKTLPEDPTAHYLLAQAWVSVMERSPEGVEAGIAALETVLRLAPDFKDADGVDAAGIRRAIAELRRELSRAADK